MRVPIFRFLTSISLVLLLTIPALAGAQVATHTEEYTGYMGDDVGDDIYPVTLQAGQIINVTATATSGNLDTYIGLRNAAGDFVIENDDRDSTTYNSFFSYRVAADGTYDVVVSNIRQTRGNYHLLIEVFWPEALPPAQSHTGAMSDDLPADTYTFVLEPGEAVAITAEAIRGDLDTYLRLLDSDGIKVAENDDRDETTLDSEIVHITASGGHYTAVMTNILGTSGDYALTIATLPFDDAQARIRETLSGPVLYYDTEHFRVHYTAEGIDATTPEYAQLVGQALEEARYYQVEELGWPAPPPDGLRGGDERYDVYLVNLLARNEDVGGELGSAQPELPFGSNPHSSIEEFYAVPSYVILDNNYDHDSLSDDEDPISLMRATAAHEFHHAIQFGYDAGDYHHWYYEATSTWMETVTFPEDQDAAGYVEYVFTYPEICLGADGDSDPTGGQLMYGTWLWIETLAETHGHDAIIELWQYIAFYEGWESLERLLADYGETIAEAAARYHLRSLLRDYEWTPEFDAHTVWLEATISRTGEWRAAGLGIQELAANYYLLTLPGGAYDIALTTAPASLELWLVGIKGEEAVAVRLGRGATVDTSSYHDSYVMVFNADYHDEVTACEYVDYTISVQPGTGTPLPPVMALSARYYAPLD
jgi:hypothetical protein